MGDTGAFFFFSLSPIKALDFRIKSEGEEVD
jgi:hypothetical protein